MNLKPNINEQEFVHSIYMNDVDKHRCFDKNNIAPEYNSEQWEMGCKIRPAIS